MEKPELEWRRVDGGVWCESEQRADMSLDGNGERGRDGTFSSKKVDWTQESGSPRRRREKRQERTRGQVTSHSRTLRPLTYRYPSPKVFPGPKPVTNSTTPLPPRKGLSPHHSLLGQDLAIKEFVFALPPSHPTATVSIPRSGQPHSPGRQAGRQAGLGEDSRTFPPRHPISSSAILTYNNYHDDGTDSSQHDHHLAVFPPILPF